jgi:hypothetical protein
MHGDEGRLWLKEGVTAALALGVFVALLITYRVQVSIPAAQTNQNIQQVSTALYGIFAAFVGYYAGRIPAEKAASDAHKNAAAAREEADRSFANAVDMLQLVKSVQREQNVTAAENVRGNELLRRAVAHLAPPDGPADARADDPVKVAADIHRHLERS